MAVGLMMLPAVSAKLWHDALPAQLVNASAQALLASYTGLLMSYHLDTPSGPFIIACAGALYCAPLLLAPGGWMAVKLQPFRVESAQGNAEGLLTNYFEPLLKAALKGRQIAYLANPVDVLMLHIQGFSRLNIAEPNGGQRIMRVAFAGTNDQLYRSVNKWLLAPGRDQNKSVA